MSDDHRTARRTWRRVREFALSLPGAGEGLPRGGEESYRVIAPKRLVAELGARRS